MNSVGQHKVRTEKNNRKGMFTSLGKMSSVNLTRVTLQETTGTWRETTKCRREKTLEGEAAGWRPAARCLTGVEQWPSSGREQADRRFGCGLHTEVF